MRSRSATLTALAAVLSTLAPVAARAQGWSVLPSGEAAFTDTYTTAGSFSCWGGTLGFAPGSSCEASGNTLRLGNNGAFMTLTFEGLTRTITATNIAQRPSLGTLSVVLSGSGPFAFPVPTNPNALSFSFGLQVTNGRGTSQTLGAGYIVTDAAAEQPVRCCEGFRQHLAFGTPAPPSPFRYTAVVFDQFADLTLRPVAGSREISAQVGIVPEPSTFALGALGLVALGVVARRKRPTA
jgi:hypothetical protein